MQPFARETKLDKLLNDYKDGSKHPTPTTTGPVTRYIRTGAGFYRKLIKTPAVDRTIGRVIATGKILATNNRTNSVECELEVHESHISLILEEEPTNFYSNRPGVSQEFVKDFPRLGVIDIKDFITIYNLESEKPKTITWRAVFVNKRIYYFGEVHYSKCTMYVALFHVDI